MQNSIWKLATLTGVIGVGCLVVLQVQQGLQSPRGVEVDQFLDGTSEFREGESPEDDTDEFAAFDPQPEPDFTTDPVAFQDEFSPFANPEPDLSDSTVPDDMRDESPPGLADGGITFVDDEPDNVPRVVTADAADPSDNPFDSGESTDYSRSADDVAAQYADASIEKTGVAGSGQFDSGNSSEARVAYPGGDPQSDGPSRLFDATGDAVHSAESRQFTPRPAPIEVAFGDDDQADEGPVFNLDAVDEDAMPQVDEQTIEAIDARYAESAFGADDSAVRDPRPDASPEPLRQFELRRTQTAEPAPTAMPDTSGALDTAPRRLQPVPDAQRTLPATDMSEDAATYSDRKSSLRPQLRIDKSAPERATVGQPLIYHILLRNTGSSAATEVVVEDRIPDGSRLTGTIPRAELIEGKLIWRFSELEPQAEKKISVRVIPVSEGELGSITTVNFKAEVATQTTITAPKLRFQLQGPSEVKVGETVTYRYTVHNDGSGVARNVMIRNVIPQGLQHPGGADLEYELGNLPSGARREVMLNLVAAAPGDLVNQAIVTADGGINTTADSAVSVIGSQLVVRRRGPLRRYIGRAAEFQNVITNESNREAVNAVVIEHIPAGMRFVEASDGGQYKPSDRTIAWQFRRLASDETRVLKVKLMPTASGEQRSVVHVIEDAGFESEAVMHTAVEDLITIGLTISQVDGPVAVGERLLFRIEARNRGTAPATNVQLKLTVPEQLKVLAAGPMKADQLRNLVRFAVVPSIDVDEKVQFSVQLEAAGTGDVRLKAEIQSAEMQQPLTTEEAVLLFNDSQ